MHSQENEEKTQDVPFFYTPLSLYLPGNTKSNIMASNLFGRYVWLVDIIRRHKHLTFEQINQLWQSSGLSYGEGDELALRTFHNHRKAIKDIFDIYIECDSKNGYQYYIDEPEKLNNDGLRNWLIDSYATLNQIQADRKLEGRIIFENIPSGNKWLTPITNAMRKNCTLKITHHSFFKKEPATFETEPYCLKVVNRRWYLIARSPYYSQINREKGIKPENVYRTYALDRIKEISETENRFEIQDDFDADKMFEGCCGIITSEEQTERIVIKAYHHFANYLRTLPLHSSQKEIGGDDEATLFEYHLKPTFDLYQKLLEQGDQIEVMEPEHIRTEMREKLNSMINLYNR